jgi:hypothetical protein
LSDGVAERERERESVYRRSGEEGTARPPTEFELPSRIERRRRQ